MLIIYNQEFPCAYIRLLLANNNRSIYRQPQRFVTYSIDRSDIRVVASPDMIDDGWWIDQLSLAIYACNNAGGKLSLAAHFVYRKALALLYYLTRKFDRCALALHFIVPRFPDLHPLLPIMQTYRSLFVWQQREGDEHVTFSYVLAS